MVPQDSCQGPMSSITGLRPRTSRSPPCANPAAPSTLEFPRPVPSALDAPARSPAGSALVASQPSGGLSRVAGPMRSGRRSARSEPRRQISAVDLLAPPRILRPEGSMQRASGNRLKPRQTCPYFASFRRARILRSIDARLQARRCAPLRLCSSFRRSQRHPLREHSSERRRLAREKHHL